MIKFTVLFTLVTSLQGCMYQTVNSNDIEAATRTCGKNNTTVVEITANCFGGETVTCSNRKTYYLDGEN